MLANYAFKIVTRPCHEAVYISKTIMLTENALYLSLASRVSKVLLRLVCLFKTIEIIWILRQMIYQCKTIRKTLKIILVFSVLKGKRKIFKVLLIYFL